MGKLKPSIANATKRSGVVDIANKRENDMSTKTDVDFTPNRDADESTPGSNQRAKAAPATLPKLTLYAHAKVVKSIRLIAVEEGVQAQEIMRRAMMEYLKTQGHHFTDLTTGE